MERCDGRRGNASVLTKGMNPGDRLAGDASAIPQCRHPLINKLPRQSAIKPQTVSRQRLTGNCCNIDDTFPNWIGPASFASQRFSPPPKQNEGQAQARRHVRFVVERVDQLAGCGGGALLVLAGLRVDSGSEAGRRRVGCAYSRPSPRPAVS